MTMWKRLKHALVIWFALAGLAGAQNYRFGIPTAQVTVTIEPEGSALIHYELTFKCHSGAHAIDVVDIGMPSKKHEPLSAAMGGKALPLNAIRKSTYVDNGYEIHLGQGSIQPGKTGIFEFTGRSYHMVWQDTTDKALASFRFTPTWFGKEFLRGKTHLVVRYRLPPGDYPEPDRTIVWHKGTPEFTMKGVVEGDTAPSVVWSQDARMTGPRMFGVSFPKAYMTKVKKMTIFGLFFRWFSDNTNARIASGILVLVLYSTLFLFSTRGTGCALFGVGFTALLIMMYRSDAMHLAMYPFLVLLTALSFVYRCRSKEHYIPARISRPGGNVVAALTSVQAAVLMDEPVQKILTILIFDFARKGIVEITSEDPLKVRLQGEQQKNVWRRPDGRKIHLRSYEQRFIKSFESQIDTPVDEMRFNSAFKVLVDDLTEKLQGSDLDRTRGYCAMKVAQAWRRIESEGQPQVRQNRVDKDIGWLMLDDEFDEKIRRRETDDYYYRPGYWYHSHTYPRGTAVTASPAPPIPAAEVTTSFGDVVNSITGRLSKIGDSIRSIALNETRSIDLSGLDKITNAALKSLASGSGGGGGFSGGCACACAGCACACACAGGGR